MANGQISLKKLCSGTCMVFGTTVGAGMLGIPAVTAAAGFIPALFTTVLVWLFMVATGLLLLEVTLKMPQGSNLISLSGRFLGKRGKWATGLLFLFLYYCLLVAYFAGGAPLFGQFFSFFHINIPSSLETVLFALVFGGVIFLGVHWINRANLILTFFMLACYAVLILVGSGGVQMEKLTTMQVLPAIGAIPVLFSAFGYHNIVPPLATYLGREKKTLRLSIVLGTFFALALYLVWQWLVLGSISIEALEEARLRGLPATYALQNASGGSLVYVWGQLFAFFALTTSFLGVGFSFVDFIQDGFQENKQKVSRLTCSLLTLVPPFICVLLIPSLFEKALGLAGGIGESLLNGILPVALFVKMKASIKGPDLTGQVKSFLLFLVFLSIGALAVELYALWF